jgi:hypothetical protein
MMGCSLACCVYTGSLVRGAVVCNSHHFVSEACTWVFNSTSSSAQVVHANGPFLASCGS